MAYTPVNFVNEFTPLDQEIMGRLDQGIEELDNLTVALDSRVDAHDTQITSIDTRVDALENVSAGGTGVGTLAARPAASAVAPGFMFFATDQMVGYVSDGIANWYRMTEPAGAVVDWFKATTPPGWVRYDGTDLPSSAGIYADLFAHLGGLTTPDTQGRFTVGLGTHADVNAVGKNDGVAVAARRPKHSHTASHTLTLPSHAHAHSLSLPDHGHGINDPGHDHAIPYGENIGTGLRAALADTVVSSFPTFGLSGTGITVGGVTSAPPINGSVLTPTSTPPIAGAVTVGIAGGAVDGPCHIACVKIAKL